MASYVVSNGRIASTYKPVKVEKKGLYYKKQAAKDEILKRVGCYMLPNNMDIMGKMFPEHAICLYDEDQNITVCTKFPKNYKGSNMWLKVYQYNYYTCNWDVVTIGGKNKREAQLVRILWNKHNSRTNNEIVKIEKPIDYAKMMSHDRKHKKRTGRIHSNVHAITDYECTKRPMHDFRFSYYTV